LFQMMIDQHVALLTNIIQGKPFLDFIVGPITQVLGFIVNFIFNIVYVVTERHSLGISIIFLTIITRLLMMPLAFKQQKSMAAMQKLQPEIEKIRKKYTSKDPEVQQKMNQEIQGLYAKHKVNPFSGCLPLFIQLPIFIALSYLMQQTYMFIHRIGDVYRTLATTIISTPHYTNVLVPIADPKVPDGLRPFDISQVENMQKVLNKCSQADWQTILSKLPEASTALQAALQQKTNIEYFLGINLIDASGMAFPGVIIPLLAAGTTLLSSWLMNKQQTSTDPTAKTQQKVMLIVMPIMMGWFTISMPAGVGVYWITSTCFQILQQVYLNKRFAKTVVQGATVEGKLVEAKGGVKEKKAK